MNYELILATNNKNKLNEVRKILSPEGIIVYGLNDLNLHPEEPIENGINYFENALIKAKSIQCLTTMPIIADDSGLEIIALNKKPGLFSARFAEELGSHENAINALLNELKDKDRTAQFVCDIVLLNQEENPLIFEGIAKGKISYEPKGKTGFGYDPIFIPEGYDKTYSEINEQEKNKISHRGIALKKLLTYLKVNNLIVKPQHHHH